MNISAHEKETSATKRFTRQGAAVAAAATTAVLSLVLGTSLVAVATVNGAESAAAEAGSGGMLDSSSGGPLGSSSSFATSPSADVAAPAAVTTIAPAGAVTVPAAPAPTTLQAKINAAAVGSTVVVPNGTYVENITVGKAVIIAAAGTGATVQGLMTITAPGVTVRGLRFDGAAAPGGFLRGSAVTVSAPSTTITGIKVANYQGWGVNFGRTGAGKLTSSYLYNVSGGVNVRSDSLIEGNQIERINLFGDSTQPADAFRVFGSNSIIRNNYVFGTVAAEVLPAHADMVQSWDDTGIESRNILIEGNRFSAWSHQGIMLENDMYGPSGRYLISNWTVRGNTFDGFTTWGVLAGKVGGGVPGMVVENNTFKGNAASRGYWGVYFSGVGGNGVQRGNTFSNISRGNFGAIDGAAMTSQ